MVTSSQPVVYPMVDKDSPPESLYPFYSRAHSGPAFFHPFGFIFTDWNPI